MRNPGWDSTTPGLTSYRTNFTNDGNMDHEAHDALWIGKVQALLFLNTSQQSNVKTGHSNYEAQLVGLLLLTRIHNTHEFLQLFTRYITTPHSMVVQWLCQEHPLTWTDIDDEILIEDSSLQCLFVLLLTQLLHRWLVLLLDDPFARTRSLNDKESMIHDAMMHAIVKYSFNSAATASVESNPSFRQLLQLEVLTCLRFYLQLSFSHTTSDSLEHLIEPIWRSFSLMSAVDPPPESSLPMTDQPKSHDETNFQSNGLMLRTVHTLLLQTTYVDVDILPSDLSEAPSWIVTKVTLQFLLEYCILFMNHEKPSDASHSKVIPKCIPFLLETWIHRRSEPISKNNRSIPFLLAHFMLTALQLCLVHWQAVEPRVPLQQLFQEHGIVCSDVLQLLLASVVATEPSQVDGVALDALRTSAWSCVGCILAGFGCASFLTSKEEASSRWGVARPLCTILRLAVGEYKIQWTLLLDREEKGEVCAPNAMNTSLYVDSEIASMWATLVPQLTVLESCAESILATVRFLVQVADHIDSDVPVALFAGISLEESKSTKIPPEAVLHMQQSIREVHLVTMQCLLHAELPVQNTNDVLTHLRNVIRIFAMVISEMDVFPISTWTGAASSMIMSNTSQDPMAISLSQQLQAVSVTMAHRVVWDFFQDDADLHSVVVLCLVKVLASAEGDSDLISLLHESNILGESLVSFVDQCFRCYMNMNHVSSVVDLCDIMDLSVRLEERNTIVSSRYQSCIIEYLQHIISDLDRFNTQPIFEKTLLAVRALANCYITLQREVDVPASHASILQTVLDIGSCGV